MSANLEWEWLTDTYHEIKSYQARASLGSIVAIIKLIEQQTTPTYHKWATDTEHKICIDSMFLFKKMTLEYLVKALLQTTIRILFNQKFLRWKVLSIFPDETDYANQTAA